MAMAAVLLSWRHSRASPDLLHFVSVVPFPRLLASAVTSCDWKLIVGWHWETRQSRSALPTEITFCRTWIAKMKTLSERLKSLLLGLPEDVDENPIVWTVFWVSSCSIFFCHLRVTLSSTLYHLSSSPVRFSVTLGRAQATWFSRGFLPLLVFFLASSLDSVLAQCTTFPSSPLSLFLDSPCASLLVSAKMAEKERKREKTMNPRLSFSLQRDVGLDYLCYHFPRLGRGTGTEGRGVLHWSLRHDPIRWLEGREADARRGCRPQQIHPAKPQNIPHHCKCLSHFVGGRNHWAWRVTFPLFQATVDLPPKLLYNELDGNIEHVPTWNPTLIECRTLKVYTTELRSDYLRFLTPLVALLGGERQGEH